MLVVEVLGLWGEVLFLGLLWLFFCINFFLVFSILVFKLVLDEVLLLWEIGVLGFFCVRVCWWIFLLKLLLEMLFWSDWVLRFIDKLILFLFIVFVDLFVIVLWCWVLRVLILGSFDVFFLLDFWCECYVCGVGFGDFWVVVFFFFVVKW